MAYGDFTLTQLKAQFGLQTDEHGDYFADSVPVALSSSLLSFLDEYVPLAVKIGSEKARSELIIAPILLEVRRLFAAPLSFFSGVEFNPDPQQGLKGYCDYVLSLSAEQLFVDAPVVVVTEAKSGNVRDGIPQCVAEMVGAQFYNRARDAEIPTVYGVATTGTAWLFLRLEGRTLFLDQTEYHVAQPEKIVGIMLRMIHDAHQYRTAASKNTEGAGRELP